MTNNEFDNSNRTVLFKNKDFEEGSNQPVLSGNFTLGEDLVKAINEGQREFRLAFFKTNNPDVINGPVSVPRQQDHATKPAPVTTTTNDLF